MPEKEGYEVIRFVQHGEKCRAVMDYARGEIFVQWLRSHPVVKKEEMFSMMRELLKQLIWLHQTKEDAGGFYVTPYNLFLSEDKEILLLDLEAKGNEAIERQMKRRAVRNHFFPQMQTAGLRTEIKDEIYSLGRTMQFLLTVQEPEPPLLLTEELRLRRIISRCLGNSRERPYHQIEEILKYFPKPKKMNPQYPKILKKFTVSSGVLFLVLLSGTGIVLKRIVPSMTASAGIQEKSENKKKKEKPSAEKIKDGQAVKGAEETKQTDEVRAEVQGKENEYSALCEDMGLMHFVQMGNYEKSMEYFEKAKGTTTAGIFYCLARYMVKQDVGEEELADVLSAAEEEALIQTDPRFIPGVLKVYDKIKEVTGNLTEKEYASSKSLRLLYIRLQCRDTSIDRAVCAETVHSFLAQMPELAEDGEFQNLQQEYGIKVEGDTVSIDQPA